MIMKCIVFFTAALLTAACSPQIRVYSDHDPDYQVSNFKTFDWEQKTDIEANRNPLQYNELNDKRIKSAVLRELTSRDYIFSEESPDRIIHYHIVIDDQSIVAEPYENFYGPYWTQTRTHVYPYREGTLIIDLMDPRTNSLIWRGWATVGLDMIAPEQTEEIISRVVAKVFKNFPASVKAHEPRVSHSDN